MRRSSRLSMIGVEWLARREDGAEHVDASAGEGDDGLMVAFSLTPFRLMEGAAERLGEGAEGRLVEQALETAIGVSRSFQMPAFAGLAQHRREDGGAGQRGGGAEPGDVTCFGEELGGQDDPHSGQTADEGPVGVGSDELGETAIDGRGTGPAGERLVGHVADQGGGGGFGRQSDVGMCSGGAMGGVGEGLGLRTALARRKRVIAFGLAARMSAAVTWRVSCNSGPAQVRSRTRSRSGGSC